MKVVIVLGLIICAVNAMSFTNQQEVNEQEWTLFKSQFKKFYNDEVEEMIRKQVYVENKLKFAEHNKLYEKGQKTYTLGINQFADLTPKEFVAKISCLNMNGRNQNNTIKHITFKKSLKEAPSEIDWRESNVVTPVKNQGNCGSCWAFSSTGAMEGRHAIKSGDLLSLSEQNLVDCSTENNGCNGGLMDHAFQYVQDNGGIESEDDYPYVGDQGSGSCEFDSSKAVVTVDEITDVPRADEEALMEAVAEGVVSVAIHATEELHGYSGGVLIDDSCSPEPRSMNHGVLVVGYGTEDSTDYWLVKNSWGEGWGDGGYVKMARNNQNMCGIANMASYPSVAAV